MQFLHLVSYLAVLVSLTTAFVPHPAGRQSRLTFSSRTIVRMADTEEDIDVDSMTLEEEVEAMTEVEMKKTKFVSNLRNQNGVDYAPWMNISAEDEKKIKQLVKEKAEARRKRALQEQEVRGNLLEDSQAQELSGGGLRAKAISEDSVELEWTTTTEGNTEGYVVRRRKARGDDWEIITDYNRWGPLVSKGPEGGTYRYVDNTADVGGWVYRISEVEKDGNESDLCQCLVEVQSQGEKIQGIVAAVGIGAIAIGAVVAGVTL
eukprot:CAMPEP_0118665278 /NCGR_PEP_ID=MMETSP0785-20121206/18529_1 /TAXON_ID=91992 /ORGANISM="Bolidomonas pacifica, Strain CCMP 1866" /LENGTH=261 /DNA_ID=CAMNT_0006559377 /DNA_START=66 /DNA_END=848 /DNA_ORIENTATION=+